MNERNIRGIVIDAGHGGNDPGATGNGLKEKDLNLEVAKYIYNRLKQLGIPTTLVRDSDETLSKVERVARILNAYGNNTDVIVVSNHMNAGGVNGQNVTHVYNN